MHQKKFNQCFASFREPKNPDADVRAINTFKLLTFVENWEKFEADPMEAIFYVLAPLAVEALNVAEKWNRDTEREKVRKNLPKMLRSSLAGVFTVSSDTL